MDVLINIDVDDLDAAVSFYHQGLGLRPARRLFDGAVVEMVGAAASIYLLHKAAGTASSGDGTPLRHYDRHWTPLHLDFVVDDVDVAVGRAVAAGARLEGKPQSFIWGRLATLSDPFGHGFCFVQWLNKGYDEVSQNHNRT